MDGLSPHIEHRVANLQREAEVRRLAAAAGTSSRRTRRPRRRGALAMATASLALALAAIPGAYLVVAASVDPSGSIDAAAGSMITSGGGRLAHR